MVKDQVIAALTASWGYSTTDNRARCPAHKGGDRNLSVTVSGKKVLTRCHSHRCSHQQIIEALGITYEKKKFTPKRTEYIWKTTQDRTLKHLRFDHEEGKDLKWSPKGFKLRQDELIIPYATGEGDKVVIVEGEKAVHACTLQLGKEFTIITWGGRSLQSMDWSILTGKEVILWPDNDTPGYLQMARVAKHIHPFKPKLISVVQLPDAFEKDDAADLMARRVALSPLVRNNSHPYFGGPIKPIIEPTERGLERALMFADLKLIYNDRKVVAQISGRKTQINPLNLKPKEFIDFENIPQSKVRQEIQRSFTFMKHTKDGSKYIPAKFTEMDWRLSHEAYLYNQKIDPFLEDYLNTLEPKENYDLLNNWADDLYDIAERSLPFSQWFAQYFFVGLYQRTVNPGSKLDTIPVLIGEENAGKSSLGSSVLPPEFQETGTADINLGLDPKEFFESIQGRIIVEAPEISGYSKQDQNKIKANLTRQIDTPRLAYGRIPINVPRRVLFFATSNELTPLMNTGTGNRRFCVIELEGRARYPLEEFFNERRDDLFAAAKYAYNEGLRAHLPAELVALQREANETFQASDIHLEEMLEQADFVKPPVGQPGWSLKDIGEEIWGHNLETVRFIRDSHYRLTKALKKDGWTRDVNPKRNTKTGKRSRYWYPPDFSPSTTVEIQSGPDTKSL